MVLSGKYYFSKFSTTSLPGAFSRKLATATVLQLWLKFVMKTFHNIKYLRVCTVLL